MPGAPLSLPLRVGLLTRELQAGARRRGTGVARLFADAWRLRRATGYGPREALADDLLDPALPADRGWLTSCRRCGSCGCRSASTPCRTTA